MITVHTSDSLQNAYNIENRSLSLVQLNGCKHMVSLLEASSSTLANGEGVELATVQ